MARRVPAPQSDLLPGAPSSCNTSTIAAFPSALNAALAVYSAATSMGPSVVDALTHLYPSLRAGIRWWAKARRLDNGLFVIQVRPSRRAQTGTGPPGLSPPRCRCRPCQHPWESLLPFSQQWRDPVLRAVNGSFPRVRVPSRVRRYADYPGDALYQRQLFLAQRSANSTCRAELGCVPARPPLGPAPARLTTPPSAAAAFAWPTRW